MSPAIRVLPECFRKNTPLFINREINELHVITVSFQSVIGKKYVAC